MYWNRKEEIIFWWLLGDIKVVSNYNNEYLSKTKRKNTHNKQIIHMNYFSHGWVIFLCIRQCFSKDLVTFPFDQCESSHVGLPRFQSILSFPTSTGIFVKILAWVNSLVKLLQHVCKNKTSHMNKEEIPKSGDFQTQRMCFFSDSIQQCLC